MVASILAFIVAAEEAVEETNEASDLYPHWEELDRRRDRVRDPVLLHVEVGPAAHQHAARRAPREDPG